MALQKLEFPARNENLSVFCPLCGAETQAADGQINECSHLVALHLNIAEPPLLYIRQENEQIKDADDWDDVEEYLVKTARIENLFLWQESSKDVGMHTLTIAYQFHDD